jgi:hypothetical protein
MPADEFREGIFRPVLRVTLKQLPINFVHLQKCIATIP